MVRYYTPRKPYGRRGTYKTKKNTTPARSFIGRMPIKKRIKYLKPKGARQIRIKNQGLTVSYDNTINRETRAMKIMKARFYDGAANVYKWEESNVLLVAPGKQSTIEYESFTVAQMSQLLTYLGQGPASSGASTLNTARSFWTKCIEEVRMTNSSNGNLEVSFYMYNTKRDNQYSVKSLWENGLYDESAQTVYDYRVNQGVTPFDAKAVGQFYDCYKVVHIVLAPGQSHIHRTTFHMDKVMNNEILQKDNGLLSLAGWTKPLLIVANGLPCTATGGLANSTTTANLDIIRIQTYEYKYILDNDTNFYYYTQNVLSGTAGNVYNQGSGASSTSAVI